MLQDDQGSSTPARKEKTEDLHETVRAGLRILARIIAREEIERQLSEGDKSYSDVSLSETVPSKVMESVKGTG